jgi:integrase
MSNRQRGKAVGFGIYRDGKSFRLQVTGRDGKRRVLRLHSFGIRTKRDAASFAVRVESLLVIRDRALVPDERTLADIRGLHPRLRTFLGGAGLIPREAEERTVHQCLDAFLAVKRGQCKESSLRVLGRAAKHTKSFFPPNKALSEFAVSDVHDFNTWLRSQSGKQSAQMAEATVRKTCSVLCQMFRFAYANGWVRTNPVFESGVKRSAAENEDRVFYVGVDAAEKLLAACESREERLMVGFARFAGLRMPSEIRELRWSNFANDFQVVKIYAPKTRRFREVPVMGDLYALLREDVIPHDRSEFVFPRLRSYPSLSTAMRRIIRRSCIEDYPRALHNLRGSCITDWVGCHKSIAEVAGWAGHSVQVMTRHYLRAQSRESALRAAADSQEAVRQRPEGGAGAVKAA